MPDENRVFDVTKPSQVNPPVTSKPVIVGHHPMVSDPTLKDQSTEGSAPGYILSEPTHIPVSDHSEPEHQTPPPAEKAFEPEANRPDEFKPASAANEPYHVSESLEAAPLFGAQPAEASAAAEDKSPDEANNPYGPQTDSTTEPAPEAAANMSANPEPPAHIEGLHVAGPARRRRWPIVLLIILALLIGGYLAADAGAFGSNINLPFHIFKHQSNPVASTSSSNSTNSSSNSSGPALPAGFKEYQLTNTPITFDAPLAWGSPTSTPEAGFSKRSSAAQSDGTYAYLVNFTTNKDVQIAVTSSKFLPAARATQYYDYLQWCTGTNDGQIYESVLHFSTANKVDTPTTITCDQGPVPGAVKLDSTTIVQAKAQDTAGKVIGDIYTKNLTDPALVVFRVKDAATTNGDTIKQLLATVQLSSTTH